MLEMVTPAPVETSPSTYPSPVAPPEPARHRRHGERLTASASSPRAVAPAAALHAAEQFALASEILDELVAAGDGTGARRHVILPALSAIGIRDPRTVAATVARDALNRTAELCADLPDALADSVLADVVRTARLLDSTVER